MHTIFIVIYSAVQLSGLNLRAEPLPDAIPPVNAYSVGMGAASVAVTDDPSVIYWNPAGFGITDIMAIDFTMAAPKFESPGSWSFLVANSSSEEGSRFGLAMVRRNIVKDYTHSKTFEIITPLTHQLKSGLLPVGFSVKFAAESIENADWKYGLKFDAGVLGILSSGFKLGLSVQNLTGSNLQAFKSRTWIGASWGGDSMPILIAGQIRADRLRNRKFTSNNFNLGTVIALTPELPFIRAGWIKAGGDGWLSLGFRYNSPGQKTRFGYAFMVDPEGWTDKAHFLTYGWRLGFVE